jgi:hypothetical protein
MPGLRTSEIHALHNGVKVKEFYKESSVVLRWTTVKRAVSLNSRRRGGGSNTAACVSLGPHTPPGSCITPSMIRLFSRHQSLPC